MIIHDDTLTPEDLEALEAGAKFCQSRRDGWPPDRWAPGVTDLHKVARALELALAGWAGEAQARYDAQLTSMRLDGEE